MSESVVERLPPFPVPDENGAPPSKKIKLGSVPEKNSSLTSPSLPESPNDRSPDPEGEDAFDPVQAILEAGRKCQEEEEVRRRDEPDRPEKSTSNNNESTEKKLVEESDEEEVDEIETTAGEESLDGIKSLKKSGKKKSSIFRRNIKEILKADQLDDLTIAARKEEEERRQRLQHQQEQLKLLLLQQQQSQLLRESLLERNANNRAPFPNFLLQNYRGRHPQNHFPSSGFGDGNLLRKLIKKKHITVSLDADGNPVKPEAKKEDDDCILLSSDDEAPARPSSQTGEVPRTSSHIADQALNSLLDKEPRKVVAEVIALSSGEEDNVETACVPNRSSRLFDNLLGDERVRADEGPTPLDSDDDCVILDGEADAEELDDRDECSQDILNVPDHLGRVLVNVGHPVEDEDIFLASQIARIIKPHQIGGIRFLYDNVVESRDRYQKTFGFGCILAHAMGLGKTLQTVSFCDVFLRTVGKTVLIIVPINTIQNWLNEFNRYLPSRNNNIPNVEPSPRKRVPKNSARKVDEVSLEDTSANLDKPVCVAMQDVSSLTTSDSDTNTNPDPKVLGQGQSSNGTGSNSQSLHESSQSSLPAEEEIQYRNFDVLLLNETVKSLQARERIIATWATKGGVLLIGYEMYRMLALKKLKKSTKKTLSLLHEERVAEAQSLDRIYTCLVDPGPDCVICDEGHRIKNSGAGISQALKAIKTKRRVVLTGYPLQNNLMEYWCMVDFVRPNYLGTKVEFSNMFERPIQNGQCADSTVEDKRLMKYRSHVLHSLLEGFVQRRSHLVLKNALPHKEEWVFLVRLTPIQLKIYREFIRYLKEDLESDNASTNPIKAFAVCCKIWNHPDVLYNVVKKNLDLEMDLDIEEVSSVQKSKNASPAPKPRRGTGRPRGRPPLNGSTSLPNRSDISPFGDYPLPGLGLGFESPPAKSECSGISLEWARPLFENYVPEVMENGVKFELLFQLIDETVAANDKLLVFSQSLLTLDLIEIFLKRRMDWRKFYDYVRLDGSTAGLEREKLINEFNTSLVQKVFLISTRAGSLGINLVGANRVCIFDASWNPCHDSQAVCRVYRYGQTKQCFIYRFVSDCTLEKRIYDRQVSKKGMADRIVDEMNPNTPFKSKDVSSFLVLQQDLLDKLPFIKVDVNLDKFEDPVLKKVLLKIGDKITQEPFEHESLLIDQKHSRLSKSEKRLALKNYEKEKKTVANAYATYQRPSYSQYYPNTANSSPNPQSSYTSASSTYSPMTSNRYGDYGSGYSHSSNGSGMGSNIPFPPQLSSSKELSSLLQGSSESYQSSGRSRTSMGSTSFDRFELHINALKSRGITAYPVGLRQDTFLKDPSGSRERDIYMKAGERVYILVSQKGTYLRVQGKLLRMPFVGADITQEKAEQFVLSLLQTPSRSLSSSSPQRGRLYPVEQQLPPSNNLLYQKNANHLQITNSRNNSGGDVVMSNSNSSSSWQGQGRSNGHTDHKSKSSSRSPSHYSTLSNSPLMNDAAASLSHLAMSQAASPQSSQNELQSLSRLAETVSQRASPYPVEGNQWPPSQEVVSPPTDLEVIKLTRSTSSSSNSNSSNSRTNSPYTRQTWPAQNEVSGNWPSSNLKDPSFYTDFTITPISSSSGSVSSGGGSTNSRHHNHHSSLPQTMDQTWSGLSTKDSLPSASGPFMGQDLSWHSFGGLAHHYANATFAAAAAAALRTPPDFAALGLPGNSIGGLDLSVTSSPRIGATDIEKMTRINYNADDQTSSHF